MSAQEGHARVWLKAKVVGDFVWSDHIEEWTAGEVTEFTVADSGHFGWCLGLHLGYLGESMLLNRTCNEEEALESLASAFDEMAASFREKAKNKPR